MWKLKVSKVYVDTFVAKLSPQPVLILGKIFFSKSCKWRFYWIKYTKHEKADVISHKQDKLNLNILPEVFQKRHDKNYHDMYILPIFCSRRENFTNNIANKPWWKVPYQGRIFAL